MTAHYDIITIVANDWLGSVASSDSIAGVAELADAQDLKSCGVKPVPVRARSPALHAQIAQLVEQRTENPRVSGSIPELGIFYALFTK